MKIYISGPITGCENWREHFANAEEALRNKFGNAEIVNPLVMEDDPAYIAASEHLDENELYNWVIRRDIKLLMGCTHIYLLRDWNKSRGARLESSVAVEVGIIPMFENTAGKPEK